MHLVYGVIWLICKNVDLSSSSQINLFFYSITKNNKSPLSRCGCPCYVMMVSTCSMSNPVCTVSYKAWSGNIVQ